MARVPLRPAGADLPLTVATSTDGPTELGLLHDSLFDGERLLGLYRGYEPGVAVLAVTNRRLMMVETTSQAEYRALTSVPFGRVSSVSYLADRDESVAAATTVAVRVHTTFYHLDCATEEEAHEAHDLIAWHLVGV